MRSIVFILGLCFCFGSSATRIRVPSECPVHVEADEFSKVVCRFAKKSTVDVHAKSGDYYKASQQDCSGYIPKSCLEKKNRTSRRTQRWRKTASEDEKDEETRQEPNAPLVKSAERKAIRIGLRAAFEGISAKVPYSTTKSSGLGLSLGGTGTYELGPTVRFSGALSYRFQRLSRNLTVSELISDPGAEVRQSVHSVGLSVSASYGFQASLFDDSKPKRGYLKRGKGSKSSSKPLFWTDAGFEILQPLLSSQSSDVLSSTSASTGRAFYLFSGLSTSFGIGAKDLEVGLQFRLNLAGASGTSTLSGLLFVGLVL